MTNKEVLEYVEGWLTEKRIKTFFNNKKQKEKYIKISEKDFYEFCYKLVDLIKQNMI